MKEKKGFTLIELLAVIAILAILLIIAIPSVIKLYNNAKKQTFVDEVQSVMNTAEKQYMADQMNAEGVPSCYSNETIEGETCNTLDLSGNKNLKYYIGFKDGKISKVIVNNGTNSVVVDDPNGKVDASSVTNESVKAKGEEGYTEINADTIGGGSSIPEPISFATDSWKTIQKAVQSGDYPYEVGDTKTVDMGDFGIHTVRVANTSACTNGETSQTACGFVVEFVDIITKKTMNATATNVGGWEISEMRTYLNTTIFNALPKELRAIIKTTFVVSGHSFYDSNDFITEDKLYLLSPSEVYGAEASYQAIAKDTAWNTTRQLDYYKNKDVSIDNYEVAVKEYEGNNSLWWFRSARSNSANIFLYFFINGSWDTAWNTSYGNIDFGVSPAFRID